MTKKKAPEDVEEESPEEVEEETEEDEVKVTPEPVVQPEPAQKVALSRAHNAQAHTRARERNPKPPVVVQPPRAVVPLEIREGAEGEGVVPTDLRSRLRWALEKFGVDKRLIREIVEVWDFTPVYHNPDSLFHWLSKLQGVGGYEKATEIRNMVFGGPPPSQAGTGTYEGPYRGGDYDQGQARYVQREPSRPLTVEEETQELVRGMMVTFNAAMRMRAFGSAMAPMFGNPQMGGGGQDMIPIFKVDANGNPVIGQDGAPVVDHYRVTSPRGADLADMINRADRGERVDPLKLSQAMMDIFTKGVQFGRPEKGEGVPTKDLLDMQARIHESQVDTLKAQFGATEKLFDQERQFVRQQFEAMSPERQMEQIEKWKKLGLLGGDNLEAMKLQLRMRMWETEHADAKEQQMAQSQAQVAESERARQQFHELIDLGKNALTDALKPVTMAIGDGIRQRVAYGPPAPGAAPPPPPGAQAPPDYASMSPEQRAEYRAKLDEIQQKVNAERARLDAGGG